MGVGDTIYYFYRHPEYFIQPGASVLISELTHNEEHNIAQAWRELGAKASAMWRFYDRTLAACYKLREALKNV